jgi:acyl-CoA thioester hydrolase
VPDESVSRTTELRVRYAETDRMGVVYHANYLAWCEVGRTEYIRAGGVSYAEMERRGFGLAVAEASIRFHAPARYDDLVRIETTLSEVRSRTVTFDYVIANAENGARLVTARTTLVSLDAAGHTASLDAGMRELLERARG